MVELLRAGEIDTGVLAKERRDYIGESGGGFRLNEMLLSLSEEPGLGFSSVVVCRVEDGKVVTFENVPDQSGNRRNICCSNVLIRVQGRK